MEKEDKLLRGTGRKSDSSEEATTAAARAAATLEGASLFIKTEKDLTAIGFFTPSSKDLKGDRREKIVRFTKTGAGGEVIERNIKIVTGGNYGLPGTGDLDKWLAFQSILNEIQRRQGVVTNPVSFTTAELLSLLGNFKDSGRNYKHVEEWLDRMYATTIESKGSGIFAGQKRHAKDRLRVFERCVSVGRELREGEIADRNYIWLSLWQLENINRNHVIPIDFTAYLSLRNPIAKTLLPLLQIWFYATQEARVFEKRYDDFCQLLGVRECKSKSQIMQRLGPSLKELAEHGYLADWRIEKAKGAGGYKLILRHGERFAERNRSRLLAGDGEINAEWLRELTGRGIEETVACELLAEIPDDRPLLDQLDYIDYLVAQAGGKLTNPPGFYVSRIRKNIPVPAEFVTRGKREEAERERRSEAETAERGDRQKREYETYRRSEIESYINKLETTEYDDLKARARALVLEEQPTLSVLKERILEGFITDKVVELAMQRISLKTFEEFCAS